jgi:hypothetical protein
MESVLRDTVVVSMVGVESQKSTVELVVNPNSVSAMERLLPLLPLLLLLRPKLHLLEVMTDVVRTSVNVQKVNVVVNGAGVEQLISTVS